MAGPGCFQDRKRLEVDVLPVDLNIIPVRRRKAEGLPGFRCSTKYYHGQETIVYIKRWIWLFFIYAI